MPVYLFTFHAYASWMPDRKQGFVQHGKGILPSDPQMAQSYRDRQSQNKVTFNEFIQLNIIDAIQENHKHSHYRLHAIATDPSHVHILISWHDQRPTAKLRTAVKQAVTRHLNLSIQKQQWFSRKGSQKRIRDKQHFDYLMKVYLRRHKGLSWYEKQSHAHACLRAAIEN